MIRVMFPNTKPMDIIFPTKQANFLAVENGYWARIEWITCSALEILSGGIEILRLVKSMQNPNHTKQGVGCQIDLLSLGRKPDDRCEDLTNVEATWHRPVFWLIAIGPITCEAFWSSVLYCARRNEGRDSRAFSMCLDLPRANNTVTVPEMVPCPNLTCQERNAKWAKETHAKNYRIFKHKLKQFLLKKEKMCTVFLSIYRNTSRTLGEREMLWEHKP